MNRPIKGYDYDTVECSVLVIVWTVVTSLAMGIFLCWAFMTYRQNQELPTQPTLVPNEIYECVLIKKEKK